MYFLRGKVENWYDQHRDLIFEETKHNPEIAHEKFVEIARRVDKFSLSGLLLDNPANRLSSGFEISNAAGFNKNGTIPPSFLKYLGFDRVVVGTVTHDAWAGNPERPRIWRFPETESLVNFLGLPGVGSSQVARNLESFGYHKVPLTINLMSTPGKKGDEVLRDLEETIKDLRDLSYVDRWELNISCPNTHCGIGTNAREEYQTNLSRMLEVVRNNVPYDHAIDVKVSPDLDESGVDSTVYTIVGFRVRAVSLTNTTTEHDPHYITSSPGKGGASGHALYKRAFSVQKMFEERTNGSYSINAIGGIDSVEKARERISSGKVGGIQVFTGLIYRGPRLVRELREGLDIADMLMEKSDTPLFIG